MYPDEGPEVRDEANASGSDSDRVPAAGDQLRSVGLFSGSAVRRGAGPGRRQPGRPRDVRDREGQRVVLRGARRPVERRASRRADHAAAASRGRERAARAAVGESAGEEPAVRHHRHGRGLDDRVRRQRLDLAAGRELLPATRFPRSRGQYRGVRGAAVRGAVLQQRRTALLPLGHPQPGGRQPAAHLGATRKARRHRRAALRTRRVREPVLRSWTAARSPSTPRRHSRHWSSWSAGSARAGSRRRRSATRKSHPGRRSSPAKPCSSPTGHMSMET
jgi:hypothetical protein